MYYRMLLPRYLEIKFEPGVVLPLRPMDTIPTRPNLGSTDAEVNRVHPRDCDPTLDLVTRPLVCLLPPDCKATGVAVNISVMIIL